MSIILFIITIVVLIVVHEFGHLVAAKLSGMRVDEFGIGYPPRARVLGKRDGTVYTLNWIPFGGFVKIYGEDGINDTRKDPRAFGNKNRLAQAFVLVAGVAMNIVLAYVLIVGSLVVGAPRALSPEELAFATNQQLLIAQVLPDSPAAVAGLQAGDLIVHAVSSHGAWNPASNPERDNPTPESFTAFTAASEGKPLKLSVSRAGTEVALIATPEQGIVVDDAARYVLGVEVASIGVVPVSFFEAIREGVALTWGSLVLTAKGLVQFLVSIFTFSANFAEVAGPVGIAGVVGAASAEGFGSLLSIVALISINLALINLIPVPALDGGRLLFVIIESITRRPIKPSVAQTVNGVGFALLILLMLVVTAHDIFKLVG